MKQKDGTVTATTQELKELVAEKYQEKTGNTLPTEWKLQIDMSPKSKLIVGEKEIEG